MSDGPQWHLGLKTAQCESREARQKLQTQMKRVRELVEQHDTQAPESFRVSLESLMPEFRRAPLAAVAQLQILLQIRSGDLHCREDDHE